jgi:hypothetical protein
MARKTIRFTMVWPSRSTSEVGNNVSKVSLTRRERHRP